MKSVGACTGPRKVAASLTTVFAMGALAITGGGNTLAAQGGDTGSSGGGSNTMAIAAATVQGLPSCLAYQVTGVCFFLKCYLFYCEIETSIRVQHYVPDVVVSTYNSPAQHPWTDLGKPVANTMDKAGSSLMGSSLDSQATTARESKEVVTMKSADAIGNPIGAVMGGNWTWEYPDTNELQAFPSRELPKIQQQWAQVPSDLSNGVLEGARSQAFNPGQMLNQISALPGQYSSMFSGVSGLGSFGASNPMTSGGTSTTSTTETSSSGVSVGPSSGSQPTSYSQILDQMYQALGSQSTSSSSGNSNNGNAGLTAYLCPGGSGMLSIQYDSDLDALFWRGKVPLELLYPGSWVPGVGEVGHGLVNTWGGTYPRTGELVQSHPVKSSAVLAQRVASIIRQEAQPHIYKKLYAKGESKYVYFKRGDEPRWQAVHPVASSDCITFGDNDSLSVGSYGDAKTSDNEGYIWNLWQRYECCERKTPIFLFAVP